MIFTLSFFNVSSSPLGLGELCKLLCDYFCERIVLAKVPTSSFAEVHMGLLIEPPHMEDEHEDEDQENEQEDERDGKSAECWVEEYQDNNTMRMIHG